MKLSSASANYELNKRAMVLTVALLLSLSALANHGSEKAITVEQLPIAAQQLISEHFPDRKVALAKMESGFFSKSYDVIFTNGEKIEFDGRGNWTEIKCKRLGVPSSLVPQQILKFVTSNYPSTLILEIERDDDEIEVSLSNHFEVTFNKRFEVIDID